MDAIKQIIDDAERLYTRLEVNALRQKLSEHGVSEEEFKALLLEIANDKTSTVFHDGMQVDRR